MGQALLDVSDDLAYRTKRQLVAGKTAQQVSEDADRFFGQRKAVHLETVHAQMLEVLRGNRETVGVLCNKQITQLTKAELWDRFNEDIDSLRAADSYAVDIDWECKLDWISYKSKVIESLATRTADFLAREDLAAATAGTRHPIPHDKDLQAAPPHGARAAACAYSLLRELEYAHQIIHAAIWAMDPTSKSRFVKATEGDLSGTHGAGRAHDRAAVIKQAGGRV